MQNEELRNRTEKQRASHSPFTLRHWLLAFFILQSTFFICAATPVYFPLNRMFGTNVYTKNFTLQAAQSWVTDGTNAWIGTDVTVTPSGSTDPVVQLTPNTYLVTFPDATFPWRIAVPNTTNLLNALDLSTGPLPTFLVQPSTPLAAGPGVIITNVGGTNFAAIDPGLVLTNTQTGVTLAGNFTANGGNVATNGQTFALDGLVWSFCQNNHVTDPNAQFRLQKCVQDLRTMSKWTNLVRFFIFDQNYNPTNHLDLFGQPINWNNENYGGFGAAFRGTNSAFISVPGLTNFTIGIWRQNPNPGALQQGVSKFPFGMEFSLENTNTDSFTWAFDFFFTYPLLVNTHNTYMFGSNWNNVGGGAFQCLHHNSSAGIGNRPNLYVVPPAVWMFSCAGGTNM